MNTYDLESHAELPCAMDCSQAVFYVFRPPVSKTRADDILAAMDELERITPSNALLLHMAEECTPPHIPEDGDDDTCPW